MMDTSSPMDVSTTPNPTAHPTTDISTSMPPPATIPSKESNWTTTELILLLESIQSTLLNSNSSSLNNGNNIFSLSDIEWQQIYKNLSAKNIRTSQYFHAYAPVIAQSKVSSLLPTLSHSSLQSLIDQLREQRIQELQSEIMNAESKKSELELSMRAQLSLQAVNATPPQSPKLMNSNSNPNIVNAVGMMTPTLLMSPLQRSLTSRPTLPSIALPSPSHMIPPSPSPSPSPPTDVAPPPPLSRTITDAAMNMRTDDEDQQSHQEPETTTPMPPDTPNLNQSQPSYNSYNTNSSPSPPPSIQVSTETTVSHLLSVLREITSSEDSEPFLQPVSPDEAPEYYNIIKEPMDFSTIERMITTRQISSPLEFHRLCLQICANAYQFNDRKTSFYKMARNLDNLVVEVLKKHFPNQEKLFKVSAEGKKISGRTSKGGSQAQSTTASHNTSSVSSPTHTATSNPINPSQSSLSSSSFNTMGEDDNSRKSRLSGNEKMNTRTKGSKSTSTPSSSPLLVSTPSSDVNLSTSLNPPPKTPINSKKRDRSTAALSSGEDRKSINPSPSASQSSSPTAASIGIPSSSPSLASSSLQSPTGTLGTRAKRTKGDNTPSSSFLDHDSILSSTNGNNLSTSAAEKRRGRPKKGG